MKKLFAVLVMSFICCSVFAQDSSMNMKDTSMSKMNSMQKKCIVNQNGKIMMMKDGKMMMMSTTMTLRTEPWSCPDGTVKMADGTTKMLKEGEYIDMDGKMGMMKKSMSKSNM